MANTKYSFLHLLFLVLFCAALVVQDAGGSRIQRLLPSYPTSHHVSSERRELRPKDNARGSLIGSVAPTCTYNECRGCKYRCRAEQVPVEGNDPMNSAYHYKCVCHR